MTKSSTSPKLLKRFKKQTKKVIESPGTSKRQKCTPSDKIPYEVDHIDMDRSNNKLTNLRWLTRSENIKASYEKNKDRKSHAVAQSKPIRCVETGIVYASTKLAAKSLGTHAHSITAVLTGRRSHTGGYKFEYEPVPDLDGEIWRKHPRLDMDLSTMGRYRSKRINPSYGSLTKSGYRFVGVKKKRRRLHRLIAETFLDNTERKEQVDHIDMDRSNNKLSNLRWVTQSENVRASYANNKNRKSHAVARSKSIKCVETGIVYASIALAQKSLGIHATSITAVLTGRRSHACRFKFEYVSVPDLEGEIWKKHPQLDMELSTMGRYRTKNVNPSYGCLTREGYRRAKNRVIHRLIAETFLPLPGTKEKVGYISDRESIKMQQQLSQNPQAPPDLNALYHDRFFSLGDQDIKEPEQRSPEWFARRKGKLSGSKLSNFMFIKSEAELTKMYEEVFEGRKKDPFTEEQQKWMQWGCEHEDTALKCLLDNTPNLYAMEAPMVQHTTIPWMASSPDGFYEFFDENGDVYEDGCIEIKCPAKKKKCNTKPTYYYIPQTYLEMGCSGKNKVIFCSWGPDNCKAWKMQWTDDVWVPLSQMIHDFKVRKTDKALPFDEWKILQHNLLMACHNVCDNASEPMHPPEGWGKQM